MVQTFQHLEAKTPPKYLRQKAPAQRLTFLHASNIQYLHSNKPLLTPTTVQVKVTVKCLNNENVSDTDNILAPQIQTIVSCFQEQSYTILIEEWKDSEKLSVRTLWFLVTITTNHLCIFILARPSYTHSSITNF